MTMGDTTVSKIRALVKQLSDDCEGVVVESQEKQLGVDWGARGDPRRIKSVPRLLKDLR